MVDVELPEPDSAARDVEVGRLVVVSVADTVDLGSPCIGGTVGTVDVDSTVDSPTSTVPDVAVKVQLDSKAMARHRPGLRVQVSIVLQFKQR